MCKRIAIVVILFAGAAPAAEPPAKLRIAAKVVEGDGKEMLDPAAKAWADATPATVLLNRTPRIYQTEPVRDLPIPEMEVRAARAGGKLHLRLVWTDATKNAPSAPPAKFGDAGDPGKLYKRPTNDPAGFADAAAVMVPKDWAGPAFPSLQMGDKDHPVRLFYWNAARGAEELASTGRAARQRTDAVVPHRAAYADGRWSLVMQLPDVPDGYPLAFAVWDGAIQDRDGLKWFSIWYVLTKQER
jgi:hypothetical protein